MKFDHITGTGFLVKAVNILRDDRLNPTSLLKVCQGRVRRIGARIQDIDGQWFKPGKKRLRAAAERRE
jgi:hypothetical protein